MVHSSILTVMMEMKYKISQEQCEEIKAARKANRDMQIDRRFKALGLRCERKTLDVIAQETGFHRLHVSNLIKKYS